MATKSIELNEKIKQIAEHLGYTSSRFADHTGISRPVMSHLFASRNKASLDIIQRILIAFPDLGIDWTFDGNQLDLEVLNKIASGSDESSDSMEEQSDVQKRTISKIVICHTDGTFTDYESEGLSVSLIGGERVNSSSGKPVDKIMVFYSDNSLEEFRAA